MKATILTYLEKAGVRSYDPVVKQVASALRKSGHAVSVLGIHDGLRKMVSGAASRTWSSI